MTTSMYTEAESASQSTAPLVDVELLKEIARKALVDALNSVRRVGLIVTVTTILILIR